MTAGQRIRELRKNKKMSGTDLAEQIKTTAATISQIENGRNMPSADMLIRMSDCLETSIDYILKGKSDEVRIFQKGVLIGNNSTNEYTENSNEILIHLINTKDDVILAKDEQIKLQNKIIEMLERK
ncbi:MAG: helix-turn-helix domain-containing protein [Candidatus Cloacimonetes bacterium]|nr:helix-turn-helix domain-containing protein [Candidatus Cloacimonadota bacterium]